MNPSSASPQQSTGQRARRRPAAVLGFTLVEVTMAIGIISFAFIATIGLLPVGLSVSRQAIETTIQSQIVQQMMTQALQTDFSQLGTLATADPYFFDEQGKATRPENSIYKAGFSVSKTTSLPGNLDTQKLATVTIYILNTNGSASRAAADLATASGVKKLTVLIPDNGL